MSESDRVPTQPNRPPQESDAIGPESEPLSGFEDLFEAPTEVDATNDQEPVSSSSETDGPRTAGRSGRARRVIALSFAGLALFAAGCYAGFLFAADGTDSEPGTTAAIKPALDLAGAGVFDSFARQGDSLGVADSGQTWQEVSGRWGIDDANAVVLEPSAAGPSIALANMRATAGVVQATMPSTERAAGLVFRYESPLNHWALTAAPGSATWVVTKLENGEPETVATLGTTPGGANVTIAVEFVEDQLTFLVDGVARQTLEDSFLAESRRVGMIARDTGASWTNFVAVALSE